MSHHKDHRSPDLHVSFSFLAKKPFFTHGFFSFQLAPIPYRELLSTLHSARKLAYRARKRTLQGCAPKPPASSLAPKPRCLVVVATPQELRTVHLPPRVAGPVESLDLVGPSLPGWKKRALPTCSLEEHETLGASWSICASFRE